MARVRYRESKLRRQLRRWPEALRADLRMVMTMNGTLLANEIEARAPKDEGDMAEQVSFKVSNDGLSVRVGYGKQAGFKRAWKAGGFKALWQEYGTVNHGPQPFIGPAFRAKLNDALRRIEAAVNRTIRRASEL